LAIFDAFGRAWEEKEPAPVHQEEGKTNKHRIRLRNRMLVLIMAGILPMSPDIASNMVV
jgi:hypothetical protein